jgi:ribose transport system permease protein
METSEKDKTTAEPKPRPAIAAETPKPAFGEAMLTSRNFLIKYNAPLILLVLIIVSSIVSPVFFTSRNLTTVLVQQVPYLIISMGVMLTIMTAGIDLSVAAVAGCANVFVAMLITQWGFSSVGMLFAAIALTLVLGCAFGALNGFFIGKVRMAPFIISLAMMSVAQGVTYIVSGGAQFRMKDEFPAAAALNEFARIKDPIGIPIAIYLVVLIILVFWFIMRFTPFGRYVLAVGSNEKAVQLAGINVTKYKFIVYIISGGLAAAAGVFNTGRTALGTPLSAIQSDLALTTVAACVIGGVALEGGKGTVAFTVVGVLILALIQNIMNLAGLATYPQYVVKGAVIILAIFLSKLGTKTA